MPKEWINDKHIVDPDICSSDMKYNMAIYDATYNEMLLCQYKNFFY